MMHQVVVMKYMECNHVMACTDEYRNVVRDRTGGKTWNSPASTACLAILVTGPDKLAIRAANCVA